MCPPPGVPVIGPSFATKPIKKAQEVVNMPAKYIESKVPSPKAFKPVTTTDKLTGKVEKKTNKIFDL